MHSIWSMHTNFAMQMIDLNGLFRWVTYGGQWSEKRFSKLNNCYNYWINWKSIHCTQVSRIVRRTQLPSEWMNLLANARDFRDFEHYLGPNTRLLEVFPLERVHCTWFDRERERKMWLIAKKSGFSKRTVFSNVKDSSETMVLFQASCKFNLFKLQLEVDRWCL